MTKSELEDFLTNAVDDGWITTMTALIVNLTYVELSRFGDIPDPWKLSTGPWGEVVFIWRNDQSRFDLEIPAEGPVVFTTKDLDSRDDYNGSFSLDNVSDERLSNIRSLILMAS